jgi:t-SNARE complex subunit (syntaxin)
MNNFKNAMALQEQIIQGEEADVLSNANDLAFKISDLQTQFRNQHASFKKTYNLYVIFSVIFLMILMFIFITKKVILGATTSPR